MSPIRRLWLQLKYCVTPYRELRRPSFPIDPKYLEVRGSVNAIKPDRKAKA